MFASWLAALFGRFCRKPGCPRDVRWRPVIAALCFAALHPSPATAQDSVLITEFMAINHTTVAGQDVAFPDWIEIYNAGSNRVNLDGWYLTDDAANLARWRFPATNLAPYAFMVIFASGTSQTNLSSPLSTNFRLDGGGEYLALVKPDGITIAWDYAPLYPLQVADISYGLDMALMTNMLVSAGDNGSCLVPAADPGTDWRLPGFDDSGWISGQTGAGYDPEGHYFGFVQTDLQDAMQGVNASALIRVPFTIGDPSAFTDLRLRLLYDDGFAAYLNGQEVARRNAPATLSWNSAATAAHGLPVPADPTLQDFDNAGSAFSVASLPGTFSPTVISADSGSTGKYLRLANTTANIQNTVVFDRSAAGPFNTVVATFDFRITTAGSRADGLGFALLPTAIYGTNGPAIASLSGLGEEANAAGAIGVGFDIHQNTGEINNNHVSLHYNGALISNPVASPSFDLASGSFHRAQITISFTGSNALVTVTLTPNVYSGPGPSQTLFSNFVIPGVSAYEGRAAFGARTGGQNANHDLDNVNIQFVPPSSLDPEEFDITPFLSSLHSGGNVLAIQGLNVAADDSDFLILPELIARQVAVRTDSPGYFARPTPGGPNLGVAPGFAPTPQILTAGGIFASNLFVQMATLDSPMEIRYTLDGSEPTPAATLYTGPIPLTGSATLRARGFGPGVLPSPISSQAYTLLATDIVSFNSNLPLIIINTFGKPVIQENKTPATITFIDTFHGRSSLVLAPELEVRAGIEIRGQSSTQFPKKSYGVEIRDESDEDLHVSPFGLPPESDWVLYAPYTDKTFLNDFLAYELHEKMGHYAVRRRFVEVFVDSGGGKLSYSQDYAGIYVLLERIKISKSRLDLDEVGPGDDAEPNISGGYIFKKDKDSPGDVNFTTSSGELLKYDDPKGTDLTAAQRAWLLNYINQFESALYAPNWATATGTNHYSAYIDVDSFVDTHWIVEYTKNIDGYRLSDFFHKVRGGKVFMDPIWDWNLSFGNADYLQGWQTNGWYYAQNGSPPDDPISDNEHIWLRQLVGLPSGSPPGDPDFQQKLADRWSILRTNILATSNVLARVDELAALLNEAQARDFQRWPRLGLYIWPNPDDYALITTYAGTIDWMKRWITGRFAWIDSQYPLAAPLFNHPGGLVGTGFYCLISATNPVYFTLDGTDPRAPGGALSPGALLYTAPFLITSSSHVAARARTSGGAWGPVSTVNFFTRLPSLAITEIMYHPQPPPLGSPFVASDFEFLEVKNTGTDPVNLRNVQLSGTVAFTFPNLVLNGSQRTLVVHNKAAFQSRYGLSANVAGEFTGSLNNQSGRLVLTGPLGEPILDVSYRDDWYPITDGAGFSLVLTNENVLPSALSSALSWRPSSGPSGSPGSNDAPRATFPQVVINEALPHVDPPALATIELYNPSPSAAVVGGWFLSDDLQKPMKFRIPTNTVIPAGGFRLFDERDFNFNNTAGVPFTLDPAGGQIYLFSAGSRTNLTGYLHGFSFGAQHSGVTFGRYSPGTGPDQFVAQSLNTLGSPNAYPLVGPVVISEIMYHPPDVLAGGNDYDDTEDEFIELYNITGADVPLYDPVHPTNTWQLDQAVRFSFPQGTVLPSDGYLLVVSFDPASNPARLASFLSRYSIDPEITPVLGPYAGKLQNSDDALDLKMPDSPGLDGMAAYVLVDRVHYDDQAPWPAAADGMGFSLQRVEPAEFGNDPANWAAAPPTPGYNYGSGSAPIIVTQPLGKSVLASTNVALTVAAAGGGPYRYQWRFEGQNIAGATNASLLLNNVQPANAGAYQAVVLNSSSAVVSTSAVLTVALPIRIVSPPQSRNVRLASVASTAPMDGTFSVSILGGLAPVRYQWRFNGGDIPGATNSTFALNAVSTANHGVFQVLIRDALSSALSDPANLNVLVTPTVLQTWPYARTAMQGDNVAFTVSVSGFPPPFTFQWKRVPNTLTNMTVNSTTASFTLFNVQPSNSALYRVVVTNLANADNPGPISSTASSVVVLSDANHNHIPDDWELQYGLRLDDPNAANADPDHDGMSNAQEYLAGTNPTNASSSLRLGRLILGGGTTVRFDAAADRAYSVQYKGTLTDLNWTNLVNLPPRDSNWSAVVFDPTTNRSRYYRVVIPAPAP